ncbi:hypothetical protein HELRODRAFT_75568, partial [Helobdella robusta]|uniref:Oxysterol-binding protein n=1 Tax=Helobdella robusta TaxID=6412 RepID=T1G266_HELRO
RTCLPAPMYERNDVNVISILKQCIGKELSKITMPVVLNEPLSFLQRMVEYMEYSNLLLSAHQSNDPIERLELVTAFAVSATSSNWERIGKPFNPLLGETFELDRPDMGFRIVCEQVSHHPPVSAFHGEGDHFTFHGSIQPKMKFWGKSIEVTPKGTITLYLKKHKEIYTWHNVNCSVNNIFVGKLWIEHSGTMEVTNRTKNLKCTLNFKSADFLGRDVHKVEGFLYDSSQKKTRALYGKWLDALYSYDIGTYEAYIKTIRRSPSPFNLVKSPSEVIPSRGSSSNLNLTNQKCLWEATPRPQNSSMYYNFTKFAMTLNELPPQLSSPPTTSSSSPLPPTDSRFRPDVRAMEEGDIEKAASEKTRIEEKQRAMMKDRKIHKKDNEAKWFKWGKDEMSGNDEWLFTGLYWGRSFKDCENIF